MLLNEKGRIDSAILHFSSPPDRSVGSHEHNRRKETQAASLLKYLRYGDSRPQISGEYIKKLSNIHFFQKVSRDVRFVAPREPRVTLEATQRNQERRSHIRVPAKSAPGAGRRA
jgi:hypothetical protein